MTTNDHLLFSGAFKRFKWDTCSIILLRHSEAFEILSIVLKTGETPALSGIEQLEKNTKKLTLPHPFIVLF